MVGKLSPELQKQRNTLVQNLSTAEQTRLSLEKSIASSKTLGIKENAEGQFTGFDSQESRSKFMKTFFSKEENNQAMAGAVSSYGKSTENYDTLLSVNEKN